MLVKRRRDNRAKIETGEGRNNKYIKTCSRRLCRRSAKSYEGNEAKVEVNVEKKRCLAVCRKLEVEVEVVQDLDGNRLC